jgi:hypothetical protein
MNQVELNSMQRVGPGTHLHRLLAAWGIAPMDGCYCDDRVAEMDRQGPQWCSENIDEIADWLIEEARERQLLGVLARIVPGPAQIAARRLVWHAIALAEGTSA